MAATVSSPSLKSLLGAPQRPRCYRRSTTTKAPRKRTFVNLYMEKHNPGFLSAGSGSLLCKATAVSSTELLQQCSGGDNNGVRGGGNAGGRGGNNNNGGNGQPGDSQPAPRALVVGAAVLMAALVLLPSQQAVASGPGLRRAARVAGATSHGPSTPRSMCLNNKAAASSTSAPLAEDAIVYGQVPLTDAERRLLARSTRQIFFSEYVRVGAGALGRA